MVVGFTTTYAISAYHHWCEFESIRGMCTTSCDKVCQWLATGRWFSLGPLVSSTNKTDRHVIVESGIKDHKTNQLFLISTNLIEPTTVQNYLCMVFMNFVFYYVDLKSKIQQRTLWENALNFPSLKPLNHWKETWLLCSFSSSM